jgi:hypothetical protein
VEPPCPGQRRPRIELAPDWGVLAVFAATALLAGLFSGVTINRVKDALIASYLHGGAVDPIALLGTLQPIDAILTIGTGRKRGAPPVPPIPAGWGPSCAVRGCFPPA